MELSAVLCVKGEERKPPTRILEEPAQPTFLPSAITYRYFFYTLHQKCSSITLSEPPVLLLAARRAALRIGEGPRKDSVCKILTL